MSRRALLGGLGLAGAGVAIGSVTGGGATRCSSWHRRPVRPHRPDQSIVPFYGTHQAGIATPAQDRLVFATLNVVDGADRTDVCGTCLSDWSDAAAKMTKGQLVGEDSDLDAPPLDTGEAVGSPVSGLTVTIGYGPSLFDDRFGLAPKKPALLVDLPALPNEDLDPDYIGRRPVHPGLLGRPAGGLPRRAQPGPPGHGRGRAQLDGARVRPDVHHQHRRGHASQPARVQGRHPQHQGPADRPHGRLRLGGRRVRPAMDAGWELPGRPPHPRCSSRTGTATTSATSRTSSAGPRPPGAPLTGGTRVHHAQLHRQGRPGPLVIPADAHIRLASHEENGGTRILRRGYSFTDGIDPVRGTLLGGLFFIAFMKGPSQFITLQQKLGTSDALNEYIQHTGSALFAVPPGVTRGRHWGDALFS